MAKKEKKAANEKKDRIFTISGLKKEFRRIRWAHAAGKNGEPGVLENSASSLMYMAFFAALLTGFDAVCAIVMKIAGIY